jgi:predicted RND superfamily exporter protein
VSSITAGIIVDNTIHLFWSIRKAEGGGPEARRELARSLGAITSTSLVLTGGFLVLGCSDLRTFHLFGILLATGVAASWLCNILLFAPYIEAGFREAGP